MPKKFSTQRMYPLAQSTAMKRPQDGSQRSDRLTFSTQDIQQKASVEV